MMNNLKEDKIKLIVSYSITGLVEGKDYNVTLSVVNSKIQLEIFYLIDGP
jgi:hypothetical protein